ncbi:hypothetical protein SPBR_08295 [Sporothrix brasiliensis 5110]|uniref:Amidase domain-containing protein n=1 Tax=Sporothrix brasiliensis 5110 TaxID=1398154 RepID=A0A0C2IHK5_9PEZI|nr:uncharacterized protein SPBR_08295 [Sporothrix brasiliensis 5110]KIH86495.1 hypothetical protein SPBR_08295 [Sporothrix brasiliensis 5110]
MSLASLSDPTVDDPVVTREKLHDLARRNGFQVAPQHEAAYLLGLRSSYAIATQIDALPDYIDPRLRIVPTRNENDSATAASPRKYSRPDPADNPLNAWCHQCDVTAVVEPASSASATSSESSQTSLLKGRSVVVKDTVAVGGLPQTLGTLPEFIGSSGNEYPVSPIDATVVRRLLLAGARLKGTTTCEHFSLSPMSFSSIWGPVHNPWQRGYNSGGSSSGSAALVGEQVRAAATKAVSATLEAPLIAIGGDQAGSIRVPAAYCGIYGLKPTFGLVPYTGVAGLLPMIDHVGPLATSLDDIALCLTVLAGYDGLDPRMGPESPLREHVVAYHEELQRFTEAATAERASPLRVGLITESFSIPGTDSNNAACVRAAAYNHFGAMGAVVEDVSVPLHSLGAAIWTAAVRNQMASHAFGGRAPDILAHDLPHIAPDVRVHHKSQQFYDVVTAHNPSVVLATMVEMLLGEELPYAAQNKARRHVLQLRAAYDAALADYDVLVSPTAPAVAPPLPDMTDRDTDGRSSAERLLRLAAGSINNTAPFNATGHPAISVPCGWAPSLDRQCMLPVGMQIAGKRFDDLGVLKAARVFELGGGGLGQRPSPPT